MEKRITYEIKPSNPLLWLSVLLLAGSVGLRVAFACVGKETGNQATWQLILFCFAVVLFGLILIVSHREHVYRTVVPMVLLCVYYGLQWSAVLHSTWAIIMAWIIVLVIVVLFSNVLVGKMHARWTLALVLAAIAGTAVYLNRAYLTVWNLPQSLAACSDIAVYLGLMATVLALRPHLDDAYHPTWGDRSDGRRVRTLPPITYVAPYIMPNRNGASNFLFDSIEVTAIEKYLRAKRLEGYPGIGITHVFLATYVRCVSQYPALNRFLSGQHIFSRGDDIQFNMCIKKEMTVDAPDTLIKLHLKPSDTIYTVYEKFDAAVEKVKNTALDSNFDQTAHLFNLIPGVLLKFFVWLLKTLDYFGLIPGFLLEISPFHGSVFFTSMGSLGIPPIVHHLYDFGNIPAFIAFGCKHHTIEPDDAGNLVRKKYVDCSFNLDERTVDGFYYAKVLRTFKRLLQHPEQLDVPPERVLRDVD